MEVPWFAFFPLWHRCQGSGRSGLLTISICPLTLKRRRNHLGLTVLQKMATIREQHRHLIETTHFLRIGFVRLSHLIDLQRHRLEPLLQAHQALGQGRNGLGQILGGQAAIGS